MKKALVGCAATTLLALGCGSDEPDLSKEEAFAAFGAASLAAGGATDGARNCGGCLASSDTAVGSFTFSCPEGGTIDVSGNWADNAGDVSFDFALDYSACGAQGYVIDGNIDYAGAISANQDFTFSMDGTLSFSGQAQGSCDFNIDMASSAGQVTYSGSVCGYSFAGSASY